MNRDATRKPGRTTAQLALAFFVAWAMACSDPAEPPAAAERPARPPLFEPGQQSSRDAVRDSLAVLVEDLDQPRHPSDGQGRAWLELPAGETESPPLTVSERGRFTIVFEVGPLGIAEGGAVYLQTSPFWDWDAPQVYSADAPGFTTVEENLAGIELAAEAPGNQLLIIPVVGRALAPGERLRIHYGAGPAGARVDRFAEREAHLWIGVDGDGDGVRAILPDSPTVEIAAREPERLILTLPTTAHPGESVRLTVALLDYAGNAGFPFEGRVKLGDVPDGLSLPDSLSFTAAQRGRRTIEGRVTKEGLYRVTGSVEAGDDGSDFPRIEAESNPLLVREAIARVCWGDLHGHSELSDGTGTPEDYFDYARNVAALDVAALTDHDHFGMRFLDASPDLWERIRLAVSRAHEPGRFVTVLGYEWTSWIHGHRHVLYFDGEGEVLSTLDPRYETPTQLWNALRGRDALTFAHHSAGGAISTNWAFAPDPELEPVTEIASIHGSSEAPDSPNVIHKPVPGNFVRDAVDYGYRLGFIGSGDSHDGHPGLVQLATPGASGGLAAILCDAVDRASILSALRARRVYATNGPRVWLAVAVGDAGMGEEHTGDGGEIEVAIEVVAPTLIDSVELVRGGFATQITKGEGARELFLEGAIEALTPGEAIYFRVVLEDGGAAWSSPIWGATSQNSSSR